MIGGEERGRRRRGRGEYENIASQVVGYFTEVESKRGGCIILLSQNSLSLCFVFTKFFHNYTMPVSTTIVHLSAIKETKIPQHNLVQSYATQPLKLSYLQQLAIQGIYMRG